MAVQLKPYHATVTGHPVDARTGVAYDKPMALRRAIFATTAATRIELWDGLSAIAPSVLIAVIEVGGRGTASPTWSQDDLPFKTAVWLVITGAVDVFLYSK